MCCFRRIFTAISSKITKIQFQNSSRPVSRGLGQPQHAQGPFGRCGSVYRIPLLVLDRIFALYRDFRRFWGLAWYNKCSSLADAKFLLPPELKLQNLSIPPRNRPEPEYRVLASSAPAPSSPPKSGIFRIWRQRDMQEIRHGAGWALWGKAPAGATNRK